MAKLSPETRKMLRLELNQAKSDFRAAEVQYTTGQNDAAKAKALKDMKEATATIERCKAGLK